MIGIHCRRRRIGASSFRALIEYVRRGESGGTTGAEFSELIAYERRTGDHGERRDVLYEWGIGVAYLDTAAAEMRAVARKSRAHDPTAHFVLSWSPGEIPTEQQAHEAVSIALAELGLDEGHQAVAALHTDKQSHLHIHLCVNLVNWKTHRAADLAKDRCSRRNDPWASSQAKIQKAAREIELRQGWKSVPGGYWKIEPDRNGIRRVVHAPRDEWAVNRADKDDVRLSPSARRFEQWTGATSFERWVKEDGLAEALEDAWDRDDCDLERLHLVASKFGCRIDPSGRSGLVITSIEPLDDSHGSKRDEQSPRVKLSALDEGLPFNVRWARRHVWERRFGRPFESLKAIQHRRYREWLADTRLALDSLLFHQSVVSEEDIARHFELMLADQHQAAQMQRAVEASGQLLAGRKPHAERVIYTSAAQLKVESSMAHDAALLTRRRGRGLTHEARNAGLARCGFALSDDQRAAFDLISGHGSDLALVVGPAGSGKSTLFRALSEAARLDQRPIRGIALSGRAAEELATSAGIRSTTVAATLAAWRKSEDRLSHGELVVLDEAAMVGSRDLARLVREVRERGARVIVVGDPRQLTPIEAGSAAARLMRTHRQHVRLLRTVFRQEDPRHRSATLAFATGRGDVACKEYASWGALVECSTREDARSKLIEAWIADRMTYPHGLHVGLVHRRSDVRVMNRRAAIALEESGLRANPVRITAGWGSLSVALGDRVVIERSDTRLGLRRGATGTVRSLDAQAQTIGIQFDADSKVRLVDFSVYKGGLSHAWFMTTHRAQGMSVDRTYYLPSRAVDLHTAYVALSRHRHSVHIFWSQDEITTVEELARRCSIDRTKATALDFVFDRQISQTAYAPRRATSPRHVFLASDAQEHLQSFSNLLGLGGC